MVQLHEKYSSQGFEILAFPCNQFGGQEPGTNEEIQKYATDTWNAKFTFFEKCDVNGDNTHPVYKFLRNNSELYDDKKKSASEIPWNFAKFLVNQEGKVVKYFNSREDPNEAIPLIEKML
uniref:Glutathione peroxidase n=1 Tax=Strombidinopsis acuminata TaxID=141414 RepID=A0A7S3VYX9_9SPIT|mmetsp:Transcript_110708/g.153081  ORF Transcript_110708/g.153081 Transcript_110708/m.153081 type:complete len:120 (+) Transcript_110708:253-612(+)